MAAAPALRDILVTEHADHAVIEVPQTLRAKAVVPGTPAEIAEQNEMAEAAVSRMQPEFEQWMGHEVERLRVLTAAWLDDGEAGRDELFRAWHDMRGQAATLGYPLAGRIADNLCRLLDAVAAVPSQIMEANLAAVAAVVREKAGPDDPVGAELALALEQIGRIPLRATE